MSLVLGDRLVKASGMSETELLLEISIMLFQKDKISLGKASEIVGMHRMEFQKLLAERNICVHYDIEDWQKELAGLKKGGWL